MLESYNNFGQNESKVNISMNDYGTEEPEFKSREFFLLLSERLNVYRPYIQGDERHYSTQKCWHCLPEY